MRSNLIPIPGIRTVHMPLVALLFVSVLVGTTLAAVLSRIFLKPVEGLVAATRAVADGNFDVQVEIKGFGELEELAESFNRMVRELNATETLRSDFINNFSHEFKTPIVSIRGFARLLKDNGLSERERTEYIDIIISESQRLAELANNVLNLSRLENQKIVSKKSRFSLDEQIRRAVLLLEPKWRKKEIAVTLDLAQVTVFSSEELPRNCG
jgi:signal transduction histidine kinase